MIIKLFQQMQEDENDLWLSASLAWRRNFTCIAVLLQILTLAGKQVDLVSAGNIMLRYHYLLKDRDALKHYTCQKMKKK